VESISWIAEHPDFLVHSLAVNCSFVEVSKIDVGSRKRKSSHLI
jgi:hypothetical protein